MDWMHRKQIGFVESQQKRVVVKVQQVFIGGDQQWNLRQRYLGQHLAIVALGFRDQSQVHQSFGETIGNGKFGRGQNERLALPGVELLQGGVSKAGLGRGA